MVEVAEIKIWGNLVGAITWNTSEQLAYFQFDKKFLSRGIDLAPIKMPIRNGDVIYSFPELRPGRDDISATFKGMPGLIADSLPDRYGNQLINTWLAQNGRSLESINPVEQLCFVGTRGMGALQFEPAKTMVTTETFAVEINSLIKTAHKMLSTRRQFKTNLKDDELKAMHDILKIGTSAGGARPKAVIAYNPKTGEVRSGQTVCPKGFEQWLIKLDAVSDVQFGKTHGFGRVEYAYYLMAKEAGVEMMPCRLLEENGRAHFMTQRFDREANDIRHHIQTFCGIQHFDFNDIHSFSYEQLFQTMRILRLTYPEAEQMFRRMVFNVMATNFDDHTKNFAFILKKGEQWKLAPAYDICYSYAPDNYWVNQHSLSINGKRDNIALADLMTIAKNNNIRRAKIIIEEVKEAVANWPKFSKEANVDSKLSKLIYDTLRVHNF